MGLTQFLSLILLSTLWMASALAKAIELPLGGKANIDIKEWNVLETKDIAGLKSIMLVHKTHKDLKGFILDGTVRDKELCSVKNSSSPWRVCRKEESLKTELNQQIRIERTISPNVYQNYVLSFNVPIEKNKDYKRVFERLVKYLESK